MRKARVAVVCLMVLFLSACTATESGKKPGLWVVMYPVNRLLDFTDIVSLG